MNATNRRRVLHGLLALGGLTLLPDPRERRAARAASSDARFMRHAFAQKYAAERAGDQPYGAVVVKDDRVVGEGSSRVVVNRDPTAHAEMEAIRDAARTLGTRDLNGCTIYASSRPCRMCEAAAYWANISQVYFGEDVNDGGRPRYSSC